MTNANLRGSDFKPSRARRASDEDGLETDTGNSVLYQEHAIPKGWKVINDKRAVLALLCCALMCAALFATTTTSADTGTTATTVSSTDTALAVPDTSPLIQIRKEKHLRKKLIHRLQRLHKSTWRWQDSALKKRTESGNVYRVKSLKRLKRLDKKWTSLRARSRYIALHPPNQAAWACIHRHEGDWTAKTNNGYYGGLQMDMDFQRTYAPRLLNRKGTANNWAWYEQMHVAEKARRSGRGFHPWPNTARYCGLL